MHRQSQDFGYISQTQILPPHVRNDYSVPMRQNSLPQNPFPTRYPNAPQRPSITSNPVSYGPPQPLEPPTNDTTSSGNSPHMSAMAWASPSNNAGLPSPGGLDFGNYSDLGGQQNFFANNLMRRPQSTEPQDWSLRSSRYSNDSFGHMDMAADWGMMPEIKQERVFAMQWSVRGAGFGYHCRRARELLVMSHVEHKRGGITSFTSIMPQHFWDVLRLAHLWWQKHIADRDKSQAYGTGVYLW